MGNTCCTGRYLKNPPVQPEPQAINKHKVKPPQSKKKKPENLKVKLSPKDSLEKKHTWQEELDLQTLSPNMKIQEENSLVYSSDSHQELAPKDSLNPDMLSYQSEIPDVLDYNLILAEDLTKLQRNQILSALDSFSSLLVADEEETVDGLAPVVDKNRKYMLMLTTQAVYLLNPEDLSLVERRVRIEHFLVLVISKKKDAFLIGVNATSSENLLVRSEKTVDLLKAIQQLCHESMGKYLPWLTQEDSSELYKLITDKNLIQRVENSEDYWAMIKVIVEHGKIGETKVFMERCSDSANGKEKNIIFLMTEEAIYTLDKHCKFRGKVFLTKIEKMIVNRKSELVVVYEEQGVHVFSVPITYSETIQQYSWKLGNKFQITNE